MGTRKDDAARGAGRVLPKKAKWKADERSVMGVECSGHICCSSLVAAIRRSANFCIARAVGWTAVSGKRHARHREHKIANAASRLDPSSSIDALSRTHPRRQRLTARRASQSTTMESTQRYRSPSSHSAAGGAGPEAGSRANGAAPAKGAQSCRGASARSMTTSSPSATHMEAHALIRSHGHAHAGGGPLQGKGDRREARHPDTTLFASPEPIRTISPVERRRGRARLGAGKELLELPPGPLAARAATWQRRHGQAQNSEKADRVHRGTDFRSRFSSR